LRRLTEHISVRIYRIQKYQIKSLSSLLGNMKKSLN
jgi:hypothetical protein